MRPDGRLASDGWGAWGSAISADGRYVAFISDSALTPDDDDGDSDAFIRDRSMATTEMLSAGLDEVAWLVGLSADGASVFFAEAVGYPPEWSSYEGLYRIWVHDRSTGTARALVTDVVAAASSPDGAWLVYVTEEARSAARPATAPPTSPPTASPSPPPSPSPSPPPSIRTQVHVLRVATGEVIQAADLVSPVFSVAVDDLGNVTFDTDGALLPADVNPTWDVYLWTRVSDDFRLLSEEPDVWGGMIPAIAADGSAVAFFSYGPGWPSGSGYAIWTRATGVAVPVADSIWNEFMWPQAAVSAGGRFLAYVGAWRDEHGGTQIWLVDREAGTFERMDVNDAGVGCSSTWTGTVSLTADGRYVAFASFCPLLAPGDRSSGSDIFLRDRSAAPNPQGFPDIVFRAKSWERWTGRGVEQEGDYFATASADDAPFRFEPARFRIRNIGTGADVFTFRGGDGNAWSRVRYLVGGVDVTRQVVAGRFGSGLLQPGESVRIVMRLRVLGTAPSCADARIEFRSESTTQATWRDQGYVDLDVSCVAERVNAGRMPVAGWHQGT